MGSKKEIAPTGIYISDEPLLSHDEQCALARKIKQGDKAAERKMIEANMRLVVSFANIYDSEDLELADLIQAGNQGLIVAVRKFNPDKGFKFATYARWWFRSFMQSSISEQRNIIYRSGDVQTYINNLKNERDRFKQELNRLPTEEELAAATNLDIEEVRLLMRIERSVVSLDKPLGNGQEGAVLGDLIEDDSEIKWEDEVAHRLLKEHVDYILSVLTERQQKVIKMSFGLDNESKHTLAEIGRKLSYTTARIGQIRSEALRQLRQHETLEPFKEYIA